ncbi:unnamed protein product [Arctogadus glacialis]
MSNVTGPPQPTDQTTGDNGEEKQANLLCMRLREPAGDVCVSLPFCSSSAVCLTTLADNDDVIRIQTSGQDTLHRETQQQGLPGIGEAAGGRPWLAPERKGSYISIPGSCSPSVKLFCQQTDKASSRVQCLSVGPLGPQYVSPSPGE